MDFLLENLTNLALSFAFLGLLFVPLERTFTARSQSHVREGFGLDLLFFSAQYLVFLPALLSFNNWLQQQVNSLAPSVVLTAIDSMPIYAQAAIVVVLGDLVVYWGHRLSHRVPALWRLHAVHHSAVRLDWVAAQREHPLDGIYSQICLNIPGFLLGVDMLAIMPVFVFRGLCANFVHSNVRLNLGPFGLLFGDPVLHRWHHAKLAQSRHNFANLAPYWDLIFGTHYRPLDEDYSLGLVTEPEHSFLGHMVGPLIPEGTVAWLKNAMPNTKGQAT